MYYETTKELLDFIKKSPTAFHAVEEMQNRLTEKGFQVLSEKEHWKLVPGGNYVVTRKDRKSTRLNSSHIEESRMPSSA